METLFAQLRLGSGKLNKALFKIRKSETPMCSFCPDEETTEHYLIHCRRYESERNKLEENLKIKNIEITLKNLLTNQKATSEVEKFIKSTARFD